MDGGQMLFAMWTWRLLLNVNATHDVLQPIHVNHLRRARVGRTLLRTALPMSSRKSPTQGRCGPSGTGRFHRWRSSAGLQNK